MTIEQINKTLANLPDELKFIVDMMGKGYRLARPRAAYTSDAKWYLVRASDASYLALYPLLITYTTITMLRIMTPEVYSLMKPMQTIPTWASDSQVKLIDYEFFSLIF